MADENQNRRVLEPKSTVELLRCALKANIDHLETALTQENEKLKQENEKLKQLKQENEKIKQENENLKLALALAQKRVQERLESKANHDSKQAAIGAATTLGVQQLEGVDDSENSVESSERVLYAKTINNYKRALAIQEQHGYAAIGKMFHEQGDCCAAAECFINATNIILDEMENMSIHPKK
jgi:DNA repair exonuclease SbcCD ATPase subunit